MDSKMEEARPQLLDLIPMEREWVVKRDTSSNIHGRTHGASSEEKKLELRLGPAGVEEDWTMEDGGAMNKSRGTVPPGSRRSLSNFSNTTAQSNNSWVVNNNGSRSTNASFLQFQSTPQNLTVMGKESSQPCCTTTTTMADLQNAEKKTFSPASAKTAVPNTSQKRTAPSPVVGWPPIRSFRKNLASSSSVKQAPESQNVAPNKDSRGKPVESCHKGLFVKINMDGVPIGRKVDLKAYDSYEKLSSAVDELFRGLLAAQRDFSAAGFKSTQVEEKAITGLLDGSGEYTLVYEDNEGDRMLVGDVPWHMFISTVKRLRVLKSSELSTLSLGSKQEKIPLDAGLK